MRALHRPTALPNAMCAAMLLAAGACVAAPAIAQTVLTIPDNGGATTARQVPTPVLKSNMTALRKIVLDNHTLITHRRFAPSAALRMASEIERATAALRTESSTPALDQIIAPLSEAWKLLSSDTPAPDSQLNALAQLETAFDRYQTLFDDPDWKPLR